MTGLEAAQALRSKRIGACISQKDLAAMAETEPCTISRFECGKQDVKLSTFLRMLEAVEGRLWLDHVLVTKAEDVYGVIGTAMLHEGMNNSKLAAICGVSQQTLCTWTRKTIRNAMMERVMLALTALKVNINII